MVTSHDKSSTITIGNLDAGDSLATVNNLISSGGHQTGSSSGHQTGSNNESSAKEQNQLFNGFGIVERNVVYIFEQLNFIIRSRFQTSTTLFAPSICFLLIFVYVLNLFTSPRASTIEPDKISDDFRKTESVISSTLTLVPGNILAPNYWLWSVISFLTYPFVEYHWYSVINDIVVVTLCTNLIEPLFGRKELVTFFFVVNTFVAFFTLIHYIMLYSLYGDARYLYNVRLYGLSGYCAAVCVTIKQILPESVLFSTSFGKFKNNNVPLCALLCSYFLYLVNFINGSLTLMFVYGLLVSWFYLRFVQYHPSGLRGDLSPAFNFETFFPRVLKPFVGSICNGVYSVFVRLHLFSPNSYRQYQNLVKLSEQFSKEQSEVIIARHFNKQHSSGDYQHLSETKVENY